MSLIENAFLKPYPICATPSAIVQKSFDDIDEQAAQLVGHDQRYQQLSAGSFHGRFTTAELGGDAWLFLEETNQSLAQHCRVAPGMVSFMFLYGPEQWCRLEQDAFGSGDLAILPPETDFFVRCPTDTAFCVITLEEHQLARSIGITTEATIPGAYRLQSRHMTTTVAALRSLVGTFLSIVAASEDATDASVAQIHFKEALLSTLALAVSTGGSDRRQSLPAPLYRKARALIDAQLAEVSVTDLCLALSVSRRTLEDAFRRQLGIGPARFIKALRLNEIRRDLQSNRHRPMADIAADRGLWHPSHFTQSYAKMFSELPSQRRRRIPANASLHT